MAVRLEIEFNCHDRSYNCLKVKSRSILIRSRHLSLPESILNVQI